MDFCSVATILGGLVVREVALDDNDLDVVCFFNTFIELSYDFSCFSLVLLKVLFPRLSIYEAVSSGPSFDIIPIILHFSELYSNECSLLGTSFRKICSLYFELLSSNIVLFRVEANAYNLSMDFRVFGELLLGIALAFVELVISLDVILPLFKILFLVTALHSAWFKILLLILSYPAMRVQQDDEAFTLT